MFPMKSSFLLLLLNFWNTKPSSHANDQGKKALKQEGPALKKHLYLDVKSRVKIWTI